MSVKSRLQLPFIVLVALAVVGCNSTDSTLGVDTGAQQTTQAQQAPGGVAIAGQSRVYFAPIIGAPVSSVTALSRRLSDAALANQVILEPSASTNVSHEIRGYFSALSDGGTTTIIHVWDVFSPQGERVHRIQGQEQVTGTNVDPWAIVPAATMEKIADQVLSEYASWRAAS